MSNLFSFLGGFCVSAVMLGALYLLIPNGNLSRSVKFGFCVCFLCMILGIVGVIPKISLTTETFYSGIDTTYTSELAAKAVIKQALKSENISFTDVEIITSKSISGGIDIKEVTVYSPESKEKITSVLGDELKVSVVGE